MITTQTRLAARRWLSGRVGVALLALLAGCATHYTKPDFYEAVARRDAYECERDTTIAAGGTILYASRFFRRCMEAQGWRSARGAGCLLPTESRWSLVSWEPPRKPRNLQDVPMINSAPLKLPDLTGLRHGSTAMTTTEIT